MSSTKPPANGGAPIGTILLLILAFLLYAAMMGNLSDISNTDAAGRGMATAFGAIFATLLMLPSVFVVIQGRSGARSASLDPDDPDSPNFDRDGEQPAERDGDARETPRAAPSTGIQPS